MNWTRNDTDGWQGVASDGQEGAVYWREDG